MGGSDGHGNLGSPKDKLRVLKRSSGRDFVYAGDGREQNGTGKASEQGGDERLEGITLTPDPNRKGILWLHHAVEGISLAKVTANQSQ